MSAERDRLAAAMPHRGWCWRDLGTDCNCLPARERDADALLHAIRELQAEAAADALEQAADAYESDDEQPHINRMAREVYRPGDNLSSLWLRDRAAALRAKATP